MPNTSEIGKKAGLIIVSVLLSLLIAELVLRVGYPVRQQYYVWQPNLRHTFGPDPAIFYGVKGEKHFSVNSKGFRGNEFEGPAVKFMCLGGSTTECLYLDDKETWSNQLQDSLNARFKTWKFQIGSIGKSGCTTRENYIQLKYAVSQLGKIDGVILMVGLNDLMRRLSRDTLFEDDFRFTSSIEDSMVRTILLSNKREEGLLRSLRIVQLLRNVVQQHNKVKWENVQDDAGRIYLQWRNNRGHAAEVIDSLPDLTAALNEFDRNLQLIYNETKRQGIKLMLVNQSALYKDSLSVYENGLLWMGGKGNFQQAANCAYYSPGALKHGIEAYNDRLRESYPRSEEHTSELQSRGLIS